MQQKVNENAVCAAISHIFFEFFDIFGRNFPLAALDLVRDILHKAVQHGRAAHARAVGRDDAVYKVGLADLSRLQIIIHA